MQYYNGTDYDVLYPMANYQNMVGTPPGISGDLSFSDISGTVSTSQLPTVPINKGGTGATSAASARSNLGITPGNIGAAASSHNHNASNITSGTLPLTRGGTGATSASGANGSIVFGSSTLSSLSTSYYLPVASSSSNGYKVSMSTLGNYIMNTFGGSSGGLSYKTGSYRGSGSTNVTIQIGAPYILFYLSVSLNDDDLSFDYRHEGVGNFDKDGGVFSYGFIFFIKIPGNLYTDTSFSNSSTYFTSQHITLNNTSVSIDGPSRLTERDTGLTESSPSTQDISRTILNYSGRTYKWIAITTE